MKNFIVTRSSVVFAESTCYLQELALINYQNQRLIYVIYVKKWSEKTTGSCRYGSARNSDRVSENYQSPGPRLRFRGQSGKVETRKFKALLFQKNSILGIFSCSFFFNFPNDYLNIPSKRIYFSGLITILMGCQMIFFVFSRFR